MSAKKSNSIDFTAYGDKKLEKGKSKAVEDERSWKGPSKKDKKEEKEILRAMKNRSSRNAEKVSWKKRAAGIGAVLFLCGVGLFNFLSTVMGFIGGSGIETLDVQDTAKLKTVLFSGEPWFVFCVNNETSGQRLPSVLEENARSLHQSLGVRTGVLHCWDQTQSGRSVAQRFKLNLKPPLSFVVANGNAPRVLNLVGTSKYEDLEKKMKPALKVETHLIAKLNQWSSYCTSRRTCVIIGHKQEAQKTTALNFVKPLAEQYRAVKVVTLDTTTWQLKLEDSLLSTRSREGGADVFCLARDEGGAGGNATYSGAFMGELSSSSASSFFAACDKRVNLVQLKGPPNLQIRPKKPKIVKAPPLPSPTPPPRPPPRQVPKTKKVDYVGSRESMPEEEALFEAVEDEDAENREDDSSGGSDEDATDDEDADESNDESSDDEVEL